jgi:Asp-tRNA(Asn)/Glu-tRNA(Gln) amidotransferase A subunit family amidase
VPDYEAAIGRPIKGLRVGIPKEYRVDGMPPEIDALWQQGAAWLKEQGAEIVEISLPHTKYALPAYYIVAPAEASSNLARYDGVRYGLRVPGDDIVDMYEKSRAAGFGREVQRRILIGTYVLSAGYYDAYYVRAQKVRTLIKRDFDEAWNKVDVVLTPSNAEPRLRAWRDHRSGADVSERYLHRDGEHGGSARHRGAGRLVIRRPAARPAAHRQAFRRGNAVPDRRRNRAGGGRLYGADVVVS